MNFLKQLIFLLRLPQWSKSIFVFLGVIYSASSSHIIPACLAALSFCFLSSAVYIYNDIHDREQDRLHPFKKLRPIASNQISLRLAGVIFILLLLASFSLGWLVSFNLEKILVIYLLINLAYNHFLKNLVFLDAVCIGSGFLLRVLAGTIGIGIPISYWLTIAAVLLSLLIAFSKRRLEKQLYLAAETRPVLKIYSIRMLDFLIFVTAISSFAAYLFYILMARKDSVYFLLTLPLVAFGFFRFIWLLNFDEQIDDPIVLIYNDNFSLINLLCFFILTVVALVINTP